MANGSFEDLDDGTYAFRPTWDPNQTWRIVDDGGIWLKYGAEMAIYNSS